MPRRRIALSFLAPFLLLFALFTLYPIFQSLLLSFHATTPSPAAPKFIGLANYRFLLHDRVFWGATGNTAVFAIGLIALQVPLALVLAALLNQPTLRAKPVFRFIFFSTYLVGGVVGAVLFAMLLDPRRGLVNRILHLHINWLGDPRLAMVSVVIAALWLSVGYAMIYLLAAMQAIDPELYDAARVDGAGARRQFWHITLPGLRPILLFLVIVATISAFQLFELPYVLFRQSTGPNSRGLTAVMYLFLAGFQAGDLGYASAIGWTLVAIVLLVVAVQLLIFRRWRSAT